MVLDEVHAPFWALFSKERLDDIYRVLSSKSGVDGDILKKNLLDFVTASQRFLIEGEYEGFKPSKKYTELSAKEALDAFGKNISAFTASCKDLVSNDTKFARDLLTYLDGGRELTAFIYGYTIFQLIGAVVGREASGADAVALVEHWHLDRKFREACESNGIDGEKAYRVTEIAKAVLRRMSLANCAGGIGRTIWQKGGKNITLPSIIIENYKDEDFKRILGVNSWEGSIWFNKESFGEALFFGAVFALEYAHLDDVISALDKLRFAEKEAAYRMDLLIEELNALGGKEKVKPVGTKEPVVKTAAKTSTKAAEKPVTGKNAAAKPSANKKTDSAKKPGKK